MDNLNQLWLDGLDIGKATGMRAAGVRPRPSFSMKGPDKLVRAVTALQGFNRLDPGRARPPLPLVFAAPIAAELIDMNLFSVGLAAPVAFSAH